MLLGESLVAYGFVSQQDVDRAIERQRVQGGRLGENLIALNLISREVLDAALNVIPIAPKSIAETGLSETALLRLMLKAMLVVGDNTAARIRNTMKLPYTVVRDLLQIAVEQKLIEAMGEESSDGIRRGEMRFATTRLGRDWATEALAQSQYIGAAPVPLEAYTRQVIAQRLSNERIDANLVREFFANIVVPEWLIRKLGPAVNSVHSMLLYGSPGNGKTTIAERVAKMFQNIIFIPHAVEVEGQIVKLFDPSVHREFEPARSRSSDGQRVSEVARDRVTDSLRREELDARYAPCYRPIVMTGGELTLEMLDLSYSDAGFYEAPLHMKAINGTFIIDDFGRQLVTPEQLLNRWIVPLESRVDYLKLHTGKSFQIAFDAFVIFSTNLHPSDLMDPAFLRRIPYKMNIPSPSIEVHKTIFRAVAKASGLSLTDEIYNMIYEELHMKRGVPLASYQPKFIVNQVVASCKFEGIAPEFTVERITDALSNLYVDEKDEDAYKTKANGIARAMAAE
ncbi:MAG: AAA family ATPase [Alphaproteobacteria bacterium]